MIDVQTHTLARKREEERMRKRLDENFWCCFGLVFFFKGEKREQRKAKREKKTEE
jgi:hypothetical protein|tara:strand:+ start:2812 stop:2976 length:165 start_codon:yes stop_codon:yes gene_type:complete